MKCIVVLALLLGLFSGDLQADERYCTIEPVRTEQGKIKRSTTELNNFKKEHPCPSTGKTFGSCPGWSIDHVIPLACGGCDKVENMQWLPVQIKSVAGKYQKDRWERKIYCKNNFEVIPNSAGLANNKE